MTHPFDYADRDGDRLILDREGDFRAESRGGSRSVIVILDDEQRRALRDALTDVIGDAPQPEPEPEVVSIAAVRTVLRTMGIPVESVEPLLGMAQVLDLAARIGAVR